VLVDGICGDESLHPHRNDDHGVKGANLLSKIGGAGSHLLHPDRMSPPSSGRKAKDGVSEHQVFDGLCKDLSVQLVEESPGWISVGLDREVALVGVVGVLVVRSLQDEEQVSSLASKLAEEWTCLGVKESFFMATRARRMLGDHL